MKRIPVFRLSDESLIQELEESVAQDGPHTARQVALIAEVERRRLYAPAGYPSMYTYCVGRLHLSEDAAYKRIRAARAARRHPAVLEAMAEARVHLTGIVLLKPHLTTENAVELLRAATHKSKAEIELLLAERFPKADLQARVQSIPATWPPAPHAEALAMEPAAQAQTVANTESELVPEPVRDPVIPCHVDSLRPAEYARVAPLSPQRYGIQFTLDQVGHDLLRQVQDLLGHEVPRGDLAEVFVRALKAYAALLEKKKHAATENPRAPRRQKTGSRHVSAHVKRIVRKRDEDQCTHVNESGRRCEEKSDLQYDHILEYARGGEATVDNIRLRCPAHNRLGADRTYGAGFMEQKVADAVARRAATRASTGAVATECLRNAVTSVATPPRHWRDEGRGAEGFAR